MADNVRSVPSMADGLKPGQGKVIWVWFKRKLRKEIKVQCSSVALCSPSSITLTLPSFCPTGRATRRVHL
jgi:hypothetical protein